jgi:hypothetical protein
MEKIKQDLPVFSVAALIVGLVALFAALPFVLPAKAEARAAIPVFRP